MIYKDFGANFQKIHKIGQGSYGEVYLCSRKSNSLQKQGNQLLSDKDHPKIHNQNQISQKILGGIRQQYQALKKLKMRVNKGSLYTEDSQPKVEELREIQIMRCLNHENLMNFTEIAFQDKGYKQNYYLVMPFGIEILELAKHKEVLLTKSLRKTIFYQIVNGLKQIHFQHILHRDVKPDNIFLMKNGIVKIGDFSLSRHMPHIKKNSSQIEQNQKESKMSGNVTTRYYRAPQIMYGSRHYDQKIDIWSLGCTLAEMILHQPLFAGQTDINQLDLIFKTVGYPQQNWPTANQLPYYLEFVQQQKQTQLSNILPEIEPELLNLIKSCLQLDPQRRPYANQLCKHKYFEDAEPKSLQLQKIAFYLHQKKINDLLQKAH